MEDLDEAIWRKAWSMLREGRPEEIQTPRRRGPLTTQAPDHGESVSDYLTWAGSCPALTRYLYADPEQRDNLYGSCPGCGLFRHAWGEWAKANAYIACTGVNPARAGSYYYASCCSERCRAHVAW